MKLVFITRKVDLGDALTGFVFAWLNELARGLDQLYVVCQEQGDISGLEKNIQVISFGKDRGYGAFRQALRLFVLSFSKGRKADGFFIHMHPIYAVIAWFPAIILRKKMILWYTHRSVDFKLRCAHALVDEILTASSESFRLPSGKVKIVGHGIDLGKFQVPKLKTSSTNSKFRIVSIGRISPVKDYETLIKAVEILRDRGAADIIVEIYGRVGLPEHQSYLDDLVTFVENAGLEEIVKFQGELNYEYVDEVYREADLFVNLSQTGSLDKTVLEAAASGTLVLTSNEAFAIPLSKIDSILFFQRDHPEDLADKILKIKSLAAAEHIKLGQALRSWIVEDHNLKNLVKKIREEFQT